MTIYKLLHTDLPAVKELFAKLKNTDEDQLVDRARLFRTKNHTLTVHALA